MKVLVTGGAGYIGSVTAAALEDAGHTPIILDSLRTGPRAFTRGRIFYEGDIADRTLVTRVFEEHPDIAATIHMAARTIVGESVTDPIGYYEENLTKSLVLFDQLIKLGSHRVVFSSSAAVYAPGDAAEVREGDATAPASPYARTKLMVEDVLSDIAAATDLRAMSLRYFNPIGADPSLRYGVYAAWPTHVLGQLVLAARGEIPEFHLTGTDYPTRDGTGLRDYVHVWDVARAHVRAVERFDAALEHLGTTAAVINIGTGRGSTVRELIEAVEAETGRSVPVREMPRRPGDVAGACANVDRARDVLGWASELSVAEGIRSALAYVPDLT